MKSKIKLTLIALLLTSMVNYAQVYNPAIPVIETFEIDVATINDKVKDYTTDKLYVDDGTVLIPPTFYKHDGRSKGILVVHDYNDNYLAFDVRCPVCDKKGKIGKFRMKTCLAAGCDNCSAEAHELIIWGSGQITRTKQPDEMYIHDIREIERNGRLYLEISRSPASIP